MIDTRIIDELSRRIGDSLPPGLRHLREDLERNARAALQAAIGRLDLVSREEFEVQSKVLARTREKLEALEARVRSLEKRRQARDAGSKNEEALPVEDAGADTDIDMDGG